MRSEFTRRESGPAGNSGNRVGPLEVRVLCGEVNGGGG